jgi:dephospho-CoA kinase
VLKIGITGGIGSGKTTVCAVFKAIGLPVYHSDERARYLAETNLEIRRQITEAFGNESYINSCYNRKYIASLVFNDNYLLDKLNAIIHPYVAKDFREWTSLYNEEKYIIEEAAILFESGANINMDYTIFVDSPQNLRVNRVLKRDKTSRDEILRRIKNQWPAGKIRQLADWSIVNNNKRLILPQILRIHKQLINLAHSNG